MLFRWELFSAPNYPGPRLGRILLRFIGVPKRPSSNPISNEPCRREGGDQVTLLFSPTISRRREKTLLQIARMAHAVVSATRTPKALLEPDPSALEELIIELRATQH
jgi:hypothetical protein